MLPFCQQTGHLLQEQEEAMLQSHLNAVQSKEVK